MLSTSTGVETAIWPYFERVRIISMTTVHGQHFSRTKGDERTVLCCHCLYRYLILSAFRRKGAAFCISVQLSRRGKSNNSLLYFVPSHYHIVSNHFFAVKSFSHFSHYDCSNSSNNDEISILQIDMYLFLINFVWSL